MRRLLVIFIGLTSIFGLNAQSYLGYNFDNYAGVQSLISNPANIVDSRFKTDINLVSASALYANDYYGIDVYKALDNRYDFEKESKKTPSNNNNFYTNIDIMGPSFMFNLAPKHAIALSTRFRGTGNVSNVD